jgi:hypothetical protein
VGRHQLKNEAEAEENAAGPPADRGEEIASLPNSDKCIGRRARAAEICREAGALTGLEQNRQDEDRAVEDQKPQKNRVNH